MQIIKPSHTYISKEGLTPYEFIEKIGRTCYKSEDKITDGSAVKFVRGLCKRQHYAMLEHYWVHIIVNTDLNLVDSFKHLAIENENYIFGEGKDLFTFFNFTTVGEDTYVSAPIRPFLEMQDFQFKSEYTAPLKDMFQSVFNAFPEIFDEKEVTEESGCATLLPEDKFCNMLETVLTTGTCVKPYKYLITQELEKHYTHTYLFVCDRGVSHELVRHRLCSFAQESTRYCNYGHDNEITVIEPFFFAQDRDKEPWKYEAWKSSCEKAEESYLRLLEYGAKPQEARAVLPNSLKTEIIVTANEREWQHICNLRAIGTTGAPHPQMQEIMLPVYEELQMITNHRVN